ncbi:carbohydrate ABC transporter permease [Herpetosiphon sp. NSE202]|uniref:carbohydrate ABC transporter permease n=1 Tax=Herpetosiphon sp. NSE202 TaxID=3351349 RepID=UPI00362FD69F
MASAESSVERASDSAIPRQSWWARTRSSRTAYTYLFPALIVMAIITFYPIVYQFWMSLTDFGPSSINPNVANYKAPNYVGFENYRLILQDKLATVDADLNSFRFWRTLGFNIWWTFSNVIFHVSLGIVIAVMLNVEGLWFKKIYRAIYILPMVLPQLVIATIWRNMFDAKEGAVNLFLKIFLGPAFPEAGIDWLQRVDPVAFGLPLSYFAMLIANIWLGWPFMTIVATGALQSIPKELYEAASIDGATGWNKFWTITLPLLRPAMVPATILGIIQTFNLFHVIYFISGGGPLGQTEILVTQAYKLINGNSLFGIGAAFSVFIFIILGCISAITARISRVAESYDG